MCNLGGAIRVSISLVKENRYRVSRDPYAEDYGDATTTNN